jgi:hypothetical protein
MAKLTDEKIREIQEAYKRLGTYAATAREVGVSASTVKKYTTEEVPVRPMVKENEKIERKIITKLPDFDIHWFDGVTNFGALCEYNKKEEADVLNFWKEK